MVRAGGRSSTGSVDTANLVDPDSPPRRIPTGTSRSRTVARGHETPAIGEAHMDATMPQIETVVMLMLENRSLDSVLGWLYETDAGARRAGGFESHL